MSLPHVYHALFSRLISDSFGFYIIRPSAGHSMHLLTSQIIYNTEIEIVNQGSPRMIEPLANFLRRFECVSASVGRLFLGQLYIESGRNFFQISDCETCSGEFCTGLSAILCSVHIIIETCPWIFKRICDVNYSYFEWLSWLGSHVPIS
jgi:hypothetical protein